MKALKVIVTILLSAVIVDLLILIATMVQIAVGEPTAHIPFWDAQIAFVFKFFIP